MAFAQCTKATFIQQEHVKFSEEITKMMIT